jgi:hypothetical protein
LQAGLYEKPKGSRKQRKEKKNRQKKVRGAKKYQPVAAYVHPPVYSTLDVLAASKSLGCVLVVRIIGITTSFASRVE